MTNTIYFPNTIRDFVSTTTEETSSTSDSYTNQQDDFIDAKDGAWTPLGEGGIWECSNSKEFSINELMTAARNFDILGEGGFGMVFKGWIDEINLTATKPGEGIAVAIKRLLPESFHGHREWQAEVDYLGRLYHPNLLRLLGYCAHNEERLLVYEFMPRGSLNNHLFKKVSTPLSWSVRMKIALGAAKGLAFLHSAPINVIHRNFKSSIILLDMDYNAKLSGFKLAMNGPTGDKNHISTEVMGTDGYAAPEYIATELLLKLGAHL